MQNTHIDKVVTYIAEGDYLAVNDVGEAFGKTAQVIRQWTYLSRTSNRPNGRAPFPQPDIQIAGSPLWSLETIRGWSRSARVPLVGEDLPPPVPPAPTVANADLEEKLARARAKKEADKAALEVKRAAVREQRRTNQITPLMKK